MNAMLLPMSFQLGNHLGLAKSVIDTHGSATANFISNRRSRKRPAD
jgi:hypothetical protein